MPDEYISRAEAIKYAEHAYHEWNLAMAAADGKREINLVYKRQELCKAVESVFRDMPASDVAEVVHGKWASEAIGGVYGPVCSVCGYYIPGIRFWNAPYCPKCGARMDGGNDA